MARLANASCRARDSPSYDWYSSLVGPYRRHSRLDPRFQDTRAHAESAKEAVDGTMMHGRPIRVRFAVHGAAVRVKELSPYVSNELLYQAFSNFGEVERAVHIVDEKGRPTGEGIVEFERKPSANDALRQCKENIFLLTM